LRVLQEREVDRLGGKRPLPIDIRVISTSNCDLREMIRAGTFRGDLFYRLNVVPLRLFPLRERLDDVECLARSFFANRGYTGAALTKAALDMLKAHSWRGNVRELFNVLERAAIVAHGATIAPEHLLLEEEDLAQWAGASTARASISPAQGGDNCVSVRDMEEQLIFQTLKQMNDNRTQAAKRLGISVRTLRNKLKQYREKECLRET
jgi:DNA-binding NtrC family response regulator